VNDNNTFTFRYDLSRSDVQGAGIGSLNVISRGYHVYQLTHTVQVIETSVHGSAVNETRFQYHHHPTETWPNSTSPALQVLQSFNSGGSTMGHSFNVANDFELQNNTTTIHGAHTWRFGMRARRQALDSVSPQNFNGIFIFGGGDAPVLDANNQIVLDSSGHQKIQQIDSIERYRRTLLGLSLLQGGGATQFNIATGAPELAVDQFDVGLSWATIGACAPSLTLNLGVRYRPRPACMTCAIRATWDSAWAPGARSPKS
jgi:outer membrane receptor protein involved in Fe transport